MSYTSEIKSDLFETLPGKKESRYLIAGMILASGRLEFDKGKVDFTLHSENSAFIRYLYKIMNDYYGEKGTLEYQKKSGFHKHMVVSVTYTDIGKLLKKLGCLDKLGDFYYSPILNDILLSKKKAKKAFLKGVFISCGSILNPNNKYHLEFNPAHSTITEVCSEVLSSLGIENTVSNHRGKEVLYIRYAESVADFLGLIGAHKKLFEFEDIKIYKEMRNKINRKINFETANINRTALSASEQISAIEKLKTSGTYDDLSEDLKKIAELRVSHPTISISKLVDKYNENNTPISRSAMHRRLKKLVEIAQDEQ